MGICIENIIYAKTTFNQLDNEINLKFSTHYYISCNQDYNCDDARSRRGSETQLHRSEYDQDSVSVLQIIFYFFL